VNESDLPGFYTPEELIDEENSSQLLATNEVTMSQEYTIEEGDITLWVNDKEGNEKRPDYTGKGVFSGGEFRVALWERRSKSGNMFLSGKIEKPYNGSSSKPAEAPLEDVPF